MATKEIVLILPLAAQNGIDEYDGIMRFVSEIQPDWNIRLDRLSPCYERISAADLDSADGAIIDGESRLLVQKASLAAGIPVVGLDWRHPEIIRRHHKFIQVESDGRQIGRLAAEALLANHPHAVYAALPGAEDISWSTLRVKGFASALSRNRHTVTVLDAHAPLEPQLRRLPKPAAVFAVTDVLAGHVLKAASREGIRIPEDISVLGVDNDRYVCVHTRPTLSSIQQDFFDGGYLAAQALNKLLHGKKVASRIRYGIKGIVKRQSMEPPGTAGQLVKNAKQLLRDKEFSTIDDFANHLKVSRRLLDRRFREIEGRSVLDCIQDIRIDRAKYLLDTTSQPIGAISRQFGFSSPTYMNRLFRIKTGLTMREYRKLAKPKPSSVSSRLSIG